MHGQLAVDFFTCATTVCGEIPVSSPMVSKLRPLAASRRISVSRSVSGEGGASLGAGWAAGVGAALMRKRASTRRAMLGLMGEPPARSSWMLAAMRPAPASFSR